MGVEGGRGGEGRRGMQGGESVTAATASSINAQQVVHPIQDSATLCEASRYILISVTRPQVTEAHPVTKYHLHK